MEKGFSDSETVAGKVEPDGVQEPAGSRWPTRSLVLIALGLVALTFALYYQVAFHQFVEYDDDVYVTANQHVTTGLSAGNVVWAFTTVHGANWHPLTWISLMTQAQLFGVAPCGYHLTNVAIHAASAVLLFILFFRVTSGLWQSAFVAAVFAIHPLHVESVAWVAEHKDVLSGFFWFLTLLSYASYVEKRTRALYLWTLLSFVVGLLAKPMLVSLPLVMLLFDIWPLNRTASLSLVREKIPFFVCSFCSCIVTMFAQSAGKAMNKVPLDLSLKNALVSYAKYLGKTFWPQDLAVFYPLPQSIPAWQAGSALLLLIVVSAAVLRARVRAPFLAFGWFWFLITLVPVIGLVQVGWQAMADRYSYLPQVGILVMISWGWTVLTRGVRNRAVVAGVVTATVIAASAAVTWHQVGYWSDSIALFRHALAVTSNNALAHNNLGVALENRGYLPEAEREYQAAVATKPDYLDAHYNLGMILAKLGNYEAAIKELSAVLQIDPRNMKACSGLASVHYEKGKVFAERGDLDRAVAEFGAALVLNPNSVQAHDDMGIALARKGKLDDAIREFKVALSLDPTYVDAESNLSFTLSQKGEVAGGARN